QPPVQGVVGQVPLLLGHHVGRVATSGSGGQPVPVGVPVGEVRHHFDALVLSLERVDDLLGLLVAGIRSPPGEPDGYGAVVAALIVAAGADGEYGGERGADGDGAPGNPGPRA